MLPFAGLQKFEIVGRPNPGILIRIVAWRLRRELAIQMQNPDNSLKIS